MSDQCVVPILVSDVTGLPYLVSERDAQEMNVRSMRYVMDVQSIASIIEQAERGEFDG